MKIIHTYNETKDYICNVQAAADGNRDALGFLPATVYDSQAQQSKLWVALDDENRYIGHLMFGGVYPILRIIQIHVEPRARKHGIATQLFNELKQYGEDYGFSYIKARVASDLEANRFYRKFGFNIVLQEKGGATTGRIINIQSYVLDVPSLFDSLDDFNNKGDIGEIQDSPLLSLRTYAFDLNIIHDIVKDKVLSRISGNIFARAQSGEYKLCATPELINELERTSTSTEDHLLVFAKNTFPVLSRISDDQLGKLRVELDKMIFKGEAEIGKKAPNKISDLTHLAYSITYKLTGFITRDNALLACRDEIKRRFCIDVLSPYDFDINIDVPGNILFQNRNLEALHFIAASNLTHDRINQFIIEMGISPSAGFCGDGIQPSNQTCTYVKKGERVVGFVIISHHVHKEIRARLCINENTTDAARIIDHLVTQTINTSNSIDYSILKVVIPSSSLLTAETLRRQGFLRVSHVGQGTIHFQKVFCDTLLTVDNWERTRIFLKASVNLPIPEHFPCGKEWQNTGIYIAKEDTSVVLSLFDFETIISPTIVMFSERSGAIVPIEKNFSRLLFGNTSRQTEFPLLIPEEEALLCLEKAYFCYPRKSGLFQRGTRIVFYESQPNSYAIGWARITSSSIKAIDDILLHYSRQGVLCKENFEGMANAQNEVRVITFDNFIEFPHKIPYRELKKMGCDNGANFVSAQKIGNKQLYQIAAYAFKR